MTDRHGAILYIGKAKNLKRRLKSYRATDFDGKTSKIQRLLAKTARIQWMSSSSEATALIEESKRIREHSPPCNTVGVRSSKQLWIGLERVGDSRLALSCHFTREPERENLMLFGPYSSVPQTLLLHAALVRRSWAIANTSADFPVRLMRKILARHCVLEFKDSNSRDIHWIALQGFLTGCFSLLDSVLPEEEPNAFQRVLWRNDDALLNEAFSRSKERRESVASRAEAF